MNVLIAGGGTGGHLFPGVALAQELVRRNAGTRVTFVGTARGIETRAVPKAGFPLELLPVSGLRRMGLRSLVSGLFKLPRALFAALSLVRRLKPDVAVSIRTRMGVPKTGDGEIGDCDGAPPDEAGVEDEHPAVRMRTSRNPAIRSYRNRAVKSIRSPGRPDYPATHNSPRRSRRYISSASLRIRSASRGPQSSSTTTCLCSSAL